MSEIPVRRQPRRLADWINPTRAKKVHSLVDKVYDRVCQQALLNRLESIFEPVFDEANFGYRRGRSTKDAMRKVWKEIQSGREWIVDGDLKDFLDTASYCPLVHESCANSSGC